MHTAHIHIHTQVEYHTSQIPPHNKYHHHFNLHMFQIPRRTRFGPFTGIISGQPRPTNSSHPSACWPIFENKGAVVQYLLASDNDEPPGKWRTWRNLDHDRDFPTYFEFVSFSYDFPQGNWMRYVNTARHEQEQNIVAFQNQHDIYFEVIKDILPGKCVMSSRTSCLVSTYVTSSRTSYLVSV